MRRGSLGEVEEIVLLAIARLGNEAYGMTIRREIQRRTGRNLAIGTVYQTLDRLLDKGHLRAGAGPAGPRDGRPRRFFALTASGASALKTSADARARMWAGVRLGRALNDDAQ
ncbi:MAG TPA: helix-turn-helix transcriptional regulator [Vicinamibacterales bacterium]|nr:helix-turn-helix transcriptional regulator [Vicinamibacterales bacterium]